MDSSGTRRELGVQAAVKSKIEALFERYPEKRGALLPALYLVQEENGWVSPRAGAASWRSSSRSPPSTCGRY